MDLNKRLEELKIELPAPPPKGGIYAPVKQVGNTLYVSGQGPTINGVPQITGQAGAERTVEEAQEAAKMCIYNMLSTLQAYVGDLNKIKGAVKLLAFVASAPGFNDQPKVINAGSQILVDVFGEEGYAARSAIGTNELPGGITVEIEGMFELK